MKKESLHQPLVTVLMTAHNAERFIDLAIESLVKQTYSRLEIIIVDDGSTDQTPQKITAWTKKDGRIRAFYLPQNCGPSLASNFGLTQAQGEYLARMDADDIAFPDRLEKELDFLLNHPEVVIVGGQCLLIDEAGEIFGEKRFPLEHAAIYRSLFKMNPIQHPTCLINCRLLPEGRVFYHNHSILAHDLELIFELAQFGRLANLSEPILYYRQIPTSLSLRNPKETFRATFAIRHKALRAYQYRPTLSGWLCHLTQFLTVALLPQKLIYPLFKSWRFRPVGASTRGVAKGWRNIFSGSLLRAVSKTDENL
jgi:glycosyltransferase involved in cell wall biosynthesis